MTLSVAAQRKKHALFQFKKSEKISIENEKNLCPLFAKWTKGGGPRPMDKVGQRGGGPRPMDKEDKVLE